MSNPISSDPVSNVTSISKSADAAEAADASLSAAATESVPELEVDPSFSTDPEQQPELEVDPQDAGAARASDALESDGDSEAAVAPQKKSGGKGLAFFLGLLLAGSVAFNVKQSRDIATLSDTNEQFELALSAAVDRIDVETVRAETAEATLGGIDGAVATVNERVEGLLEALTALSEATKQ